MNDIYIITVMNNPAQYKAVVADNPAYREGARLVCYDNTQDNQAVPARYNHFLDTTLPEDAWLAFTHQDFYFEEDVRPKLLNLDKNCLYGAVGAAHSRAAGRCIKFRGVKLIKSASFQDLYTVTRGHIRQGRPEGGSRLMRLLPGQSAQVDTLDPCCLLVHTDLIRKYNLRFDPFFDFHLYTEELCLRAAREYGVSSFIAPLDCYHASLGRKNANFYDKYIALVRKFPGAVFASCSAGVEELLVMRCALGMPVPDEYKNSMLV